MLRYLLSLAGLAIGVLILFAVLRPNEPNPVRTAIEKYISPNFQHFADASTALTFSISDLCDRPGNETLQTARSRFSTAALGWARIEFIRAGPLSTDNRAERILFWPDRRGIGLRQVQAALAESDQSVLSPSDLAGKSVALQGFGALEYLLFGTNSESLATPSDGFRCAFARAVADRIETTARQSLADWQDEDGFAANWLQPSRSNPLYRTDKEALAELVGSLAFGFQMVQEQRLLPIAPNEVRPPSHKRGLLWRSDSTLGMVRTNLEAMQNLFLDSGLSDLLPEDRREIANLIALNFFNARDTLKDMTLPIEQAVYDESHAAKLSYLAEITSSLRRQVGQEYARAVELPPGFSPFDGD